MQRKTRVVSLLFLLSLVYIVTTSSELGRAFDDQVGNTGAPQETQTCANCHFSGNAFGTVSVTISLFQLGTTTPVMAYSPGTTYDMRVTVSSSMGTPAGYGFQMTCLTTPGNVPIAGYSNLGSNVNQVLLTNGVYNGRTYVEQPTMSVSNQFNFRWTAPAAGTGSVRFYAAGNAVNGNNSSSGDKAGTTTFTVTELLPLAQSSAVTQPTCADLANGAINLTITGGMMPYQFSWNDGATSEDRSSLPAGSYSVTITDALGSVINQSFTLTAPPALDVSVNVQNPLFPDEQAVVDLDVSGGTPGYSISISGIGTVTEFPINLSDGLYTYTVTDANGCVEQGQFEAIVPEPLWLDAIIENVSCNGLSDGSASISVSGATPPYIIEWSNGDDDLFSDQLSAGVYDVLVTDAVGYTVLFCVIVEEPEPLSAVVTAPEILCSGNDVLVNIGATGGTAPYNGIGSQFLGAGDYNQLITDANGCTTQALFSLQEPAPLELSATADAIPCAGGSGVVVLSATGGTGPYTGAGEFEVTIPGVYLYSVTDANGCSASLPVEVPALDGPTLTAVATEATCAGLCNGNIAVNLNNETEPYTAVWNDGTEGLERDELCAGTYTLVFTDGGGCVIQASYQIAEPEPVSAVFESPAIACYGDSVLVGALATGGTAPYSMVWNGESSSTTFLSGAGLLQLEVTDAAGCVSLFEWNLSQPDSLSAITTSTDATCFDADNGTTEVSASGGTAPIEIEWNTGETTFSLTNLAPGAYGFTLTDANGCVRTGTATISQPEPLVITIDEIIDIDYDGPGSIDISVEGGTSPYTYDWSDGSENEDLMEIYDEGFYTVVVTDGNGCTATIDPAEILDWTWITDLTGSIDITISPNPAAAYFTLNSSEPLKEIRVLSPDGAWMEETSDLKTGLVECSTWPRGSYLIVATTHSGSRAVTRLILR